MNTKTATIQFAPNALDAVLDQIVARLDAENFPLVEADLNASTITVDSSADHDEIGVVMVAQDAAIDCGAGIESILGVELN